MLLLSKAKIDEIKKESDLLNGSLIKENQEQTDQGGPMDSYKEAAAISVAKQAKESKVDELNKILGSAKILPDYVDGLNIKIGKWFTIKSINGLKKYRLVDPIEANPSQNLISINSPLGLLLNNKVANDVITLGSTKYTIINIE